MYGTPEILVQHGYGCAQAPRGATKDGIGLRIYGVAGIPRPYNQATIFGNGWYLQDAGEDDHEVTGLGSAIFEIEQRSLPGGRHQLHWQAGGVISDQNGDDPYSWCYYYTLVFWDATFFDAVPTHADDTGQLVFVDSSFVDTTTALQVLPGSFEDPLRTPKAVLPQGFGFVWGSSNATLPDYDHHLLQLAFDFGDSVFFRNSTHLGLPGLVSWFSQAIVKDNSARREYSTGGLVSILSGQSIEVMQPTSPAFPFTPRSPSTCPNVVREGGHQEEFTVRDVPFDFAIPMLVGWNIGDICTDRHVKEIGAWIDSWGYNADTRTLVYTVLSMFDDDGTSILGLGGTSVGSVGHYKVHILGFNKLQAMPLPPLSQPPVFTTP